MRIAALLVLIACLVLAPAQSLADELPADGQADSVDIQPEVTDAVDVQPEVADATPAMSTRTLDPPTVVDPFSGSPPAAASEETLLPLELAPDTAQHLPPGPPNRMP
jgi:hypothetical protein